MCDRIRARVIRRAGELLAEIPPGSQNNLKQNRRVGTGPSVTRDSAARDAGLSPHQQKTALRVVRVKEVPDKLPGWLNADVVADN